MNPISMDPVRTAFRGLSKAADTGTAAAGAVGGAVINGMAGGVKGAATGVRAGLDTGSRSPAAAALTLGAIGAAGLVEWPLLVTVGGAALVVHQLNQRNGGDAAPPDRAPAETPRKTTARSATKSTRKPAKSASKAPATKRSTSK